MIACAFASCSKDDEVINGGETAGNGKLTLNVTMSDPSSKAASDDANAIEGENLMNTIKVGIFNGNTLVASATKTSATKTQDFSFTGLPVGTLSAIALINVDNDFTGTNPVTPSTVTGGSISVSAAGGFSTSNLPMYGELSNISIAANGTATGKILAYRSVARVQVTEISVDMLNSKFVQKDYSAGIAQFSLSSLTLTNVAPTASLTGSANATAASTFINAENYYDRVVSDEGKTVSQIFGPDHESKASMSGLGEIGTPTYYFYVFPNNVSDKATKLTVGGTFSITNGIDKNGASITLAPTQSYYPVTIGLDGVEGGNAEIVRNMVYDIHLLIAGAGYDENGNHKGNFNLTVNVVPWTTTVQTVVVK